MRGLLRHLYTRIYFAGDPALETIRSSGSSRGTPAHAAGAARRRARRRWEFVSAFRVTARRSSSICEDQWHEPRLTDPLGTTEALSALFSDNSVLQALLDVEVALARVQARLGVIPAAPRRHAVGKVSVASFDAEAVARDARHAGTITMRSVRRRAGRARRAATTGARAFVHWGATSQDVVDTAFVRLVDRASAQSLRITGAGRRAPRAVGSAPAT